MNPTENRFPGKYRGNRMTTVFILTAVSVLFVLLVLLFLFKLEVLTPPAFLEAWFGADTAEEQNDVRKSAIPDFAADAVSAMETGYTFPADAREALASLEEPVSYVREFRVINSYDGDADSQKYTMTVRGDCCRVESDFKTVICDGTSTCTITGTYRTVLDNTVFTPAYEIGITPLADVKKAAEKGSVTYPNRSMDEKALLIVAEDAESGILDEYVVSLETGAVIAERSYIRGTLYRAVVTDSMDVFAADELPDHFFEFTYEP